MEMKKRGAVKSVISDQFLGIFAGALVVVPAFFLVIPTASVLGGSEFAAPAAQVWKGVAP